MEKIKTLEDLRKVREEARALMDLREKSLQAEEVKCPAGSKATCGNILVCGVPDAGLPRANK